MFSSRHKNKELFSFELLVLFGVMTVCNSHLDVNTLSHLKKSIWFVVCVKVVPIHLNNGVKTKIQLRQN